MRNFGLTIICCATLSCAVIGGVLLSTPFHRTRRDTDTSEQGLISTDAFYDYGDAVPGSIIEHVFNVQNISPSTLHITLGPSTCGCTVAQLENPDIGLKMSTPVAVTLNTVHKAGVAGGAVPLIITAKSTAHLQVINQTIAVRIAANILDKYGFIPRMLELGDIRRGELCRNQDVVLRLPRGDKLNDITWLYDTPYVSAKWGHAEDKGEYCDIMY